VSGLAAGARRRWAIAALALLLPYAALAWLGAQALDQASRVHRIVDGDCDAWRGIADIPLPANASPIAHRIVDGARTAYSGRCIGVLGPLGPPPTAPPTTTP
jgi:hypothetical protein